MAGKVNYDVVFASSNRVRGQFAEDLTASLANGNPDDGWICKKSSSSLALSGWWWSVMRNVGRNGRFPQVMIFKLHRLTDVTRFEFTTLLAYIREIELMRHGWSSYFFFDKINCYSQQAGVLGSYFERKEECRLSETELQEAGHLSDAARFCMKLRIFCSAHRSKFMSQDDARMAFRT